MANQKTNLGAQAKQLFTNVRAHWNEAPEGRYMPYKEIIGYAGGGIGVKFLAVMATNMILSATNVLIGNTLGVQPIDMYILYLISVLVNIPLSILSVILSIVVYVTTKEKIVQAKTHVIQIKFMDSLREVLKNKYFWVIAMATWLGFLETSMTVILGWLYSYGGICDGKVYSLITLVCQNAGLVGMLLAPFAIRKWGKRFVLISTNVLNIVFIALMFPVVKLIDMTGESTNPVNTWIPLILLVLCFWMNNLMNAFMQILTPSVNADIRDYQQYVTGERIDGMFSTITAVGGLVTVASSGIVNLLYDKFGINEATAQQVISNPDVMNRQLRNGSVVSEAIASASDTASSAYFSLYDPNILKTVCSVLIVASIAGAVINVIPYFFYDLTELKQQGMVKVLKIRAFFEDFGNNTLSDSDLVEVIDMVNTANELIGEKESPVSKDAIKAARVSKDKQALKEAKEEYKAATRRNVEIKLAPYVVNEMNRFESEIGRIQIEDATAISNAGLYGLADVSLKDLKADMKAAKALPSNTDEEKELRKYKINFCRTRITAKTYYNKYYGAGNAFETPDDTVLNELYNKEARYDEKEDILYKKLFEAEENKDKHEIANIKRQIKELKEKFKKLNKQINEEQNRRLSYTRSAKPLLDANKILRQAENYTHFEEIKERYEEAKRNLDLAEAEVEAEAEA